jgi:uncharacterized coiled-coil protein SlyX
MWDKAKDVLTILIIPLVLWGVRLEVTLAVQEQRIDELESELESTKDLAPLINANSIELASLSAKLDSANGTLDAIRTHIMR